MKLSIRVLFFAWMFFITQVFALNIPDKPTSRVIDQTNTLSYSQQQSLVSMLDNIYETESHTEIQILIVNSLDGMPIEDTAINIARKWQIGQKHVDNGALILIAVKDHQYRIEVGYGLEGMLPDGYIGNLERDIISPYFKNNDFYTGLSLALQNIDGQLAKEYHTTNQTSQSKVISPKNAIIYVLIGVGVFVLIGIISIASGRPGAIIEILWFLLKLITLFALFRGGGRNRDDDNIGGGGGFGGGGTSGKW